MSFHGGFVGCVLAVVLFARRRGISILSLGDLTCATATIGLFLGRIANFINGELWGRPTDVPWGMVFPGGGPLPRHPSQLYEAVLEGLVLGLVLWLFMRAGALKRPGLVIGVFAVGYSIARIVCEFFREPDPQLGFLWGGLTMGMLLSVPLMLTGLAFIAAAHEASAAASLNDHGADASSKPKSAGASRWPGRCRCGNTWSCASAIRRTAITRRAIRSAAAAISSPRPRSARCSANCSACGRHRPGTGWDSRRTCGWSSLDPAAAP